MERIAWIKQGLSANIAQRVLEGVARPPNRRLVALLAAARRTAKRGGVMAPPETEHVLGVAALIGQVQAIVEQSGAPKGFDPVDWLRDWLVEPLPALGGVRPGELVDTYEGRQFVSGVLAQIQSGAYA
jgi:uncharacterized protein (DUF2384 family)